MRKYLLLLQIISSVCLMTTAQNVGIGISNPAEKLHVNGNFKADTIKPNVLKILPNAGTGKMLTSDAAGNASWQERSTAGGVGFGLWGDCATTGNISEYQPVADTGAASDNFGISVSISGNFAIIGAYLDDVGGTLNQGSAYIYRSTGNGWEFMQKITDATGALEDQFGICVSISGNYAIVGSYADNEPNADQGSASIYQYNGSSWVLMQKIIDATGAAGDNFGNSVSISGNYAIVGAFRDNDFQGSASIFQYNGSSWVLMQKITDTTGTVDFFGYSVSISGNHAIVGSMFDDALLINQGSATIFQYNGSSWTPVPKLIDATGGSNDNFGCSVSISGNYAIVGAQSDDGAQPDQGSASIYRFNGSNWVFQQKIIDVTSVPGDNFGTSVSISGNHAVVGTYANSASIYIRVGMGWQRIQKVIDPVNIPTDSFGFSSAMDGTTKRFIIGAYNYMSGSGKAVFGKLN